MRRGDTFPGLGPDWVRIAVRDPATTGRLLEALATLVGGTDMTPGFAADLDLAGRRVVVWGGGAEALAPVTALLAGRGRVTVVSDEPGATVADLAARGLLAVERRRHDAGGTTLDGRGPAGARDRRPGRGRRAARRLAAAARGAGRPPGRPPAARRATAGARWCWSAAAPATRAC